METVHLKFLTTIILEMKARILMQHLNKGLFSQLLSRQNVDIFRGKDKFVHIIYIDQTASKTLANL